MEIHIKCEKGTSRFDAPGCVRMGEPVLSHDLAHGLKLFNDAEFFEAHEALEDIWRATLGPERKFLQGLIQAAVALHHHSRGNLAGAGSVMKRAFRNLSAYPEDFGGIDLPRLLCSLADWQEAMENGTPVPPLPKIVLRGRAAARKRRRKAKRLDHRRRRGHSGD